MYLQNKKTIMIKFIGDQRYTKKSEVVTHDQTKYDSIDCKSLAESFELLKEYDIIGIDEGQFFPDLVEICEKLAHLNKTIYIAALNGDFRMEPFPVIARIIPKADKIKLLKAYCFIVIEMLNSLCVLSKVMKLYSLEQEKLINLLVENAINITLMKEKKEI